VAAVAFLPGCNLRCPYCHNADLVLAPDQADLVAWPAVLQHLERRRGLLSGLALSGGEPCLHASLPDLAAQARSLGYAIKLDTNGTLPEAIAPVGADYVAMDIKCAFGRYGRLSALADDEGVDEADGAGIGAAGIGADEGAAAGTGLAPATDYGAAVARSMGIVRGLGCAYEFRITCAPGVFGPEDAKAVLPYLDSRDTIWLQPYRPGAVLDPEWAASAGVYEPAAMEELLALVREAAPKAKIRGA
jgi:pyruvate formate lyase activating enzyme